MIRTMTESAAQWFAVYTRSRHEKVVAEELWNRSIESFLPLRQQVSIWKDRRKLVQLPLFPGYLFVKTNMNAHRLDILKVPSVVRIIGFAGTPEPIPDSQVSAVKSLVFHQMELDPYPYLTEGDPVRIVRGPLRDLEGRLIEKKNRFTFVIAIDLIQQAVACEIDAADVEKI